MAAAVALNRVPRVVLADDHPAMLTAVAEMLTPRFDVVAAVGDGKAALEVAFQTNPDLVLLDITMPRLDGLRAAKELKQRALPAKILFLTAHDDDDYISEALGTGARGYVVKQRLQSDLVPALNLVLAGHYFISPYAFKEAEHKNNNHVLEFYLNETSFFQQVSERTHVALARGDQVFLLLSKIELDFVRRQLRAGGLDSIQAIESGDLHVFSVENVVPNLMTGGASPRAIERRDFQSFRVEGWPDPAKFEAFFSRFLKLAVSRSRERGSEVIIVTDLIPALLRQGCSYPVVARVEEVWNDTIPRQFCTVYCGCPVSLLASKSSREAISEICQGHSNVVPIDR